MALSPEEMNAIKFEVLGGETAALAWNHALNALHAYAQASGALGGEDVVRWFEGQSARYREALGRAIAVASLTPTSSTDHGEASRG